MRRSRLAAAAPLLALALAAARCGPEEPDTHGSMGPSVPRDRPADAPPPHPAADGREPAPQTVPLPVVPGPLPTFTDVTAESGLGAHRLHAGSEPPNNWLLEISGGGVVLLDHDADGDLDVCLVDGAHITRAGELEFPEGAATRLWRNDGGLRFTDVSRESGVHVPGYGQGGAAADYDGDGHVDLVVVGYDLLVLLRNQGDGTFRDVTAEAGIGRHAFDFSTTCAWGDLDGDGRLDLFVSNYVDQRAKVLDLRRRGLAPRSCRWRGHDVYCGPAGLVAQRNRVWFQRADGTFEERTESHLVEEPRYSFQVVLTDLDLDGDLDAYVANDGQDNHLYVNDGTGRLVDRGIEAGAATNADFATQAGMGCSVADFDRDGRPDVMVTNFAHEYHTLYRNRTRAPDQPLFEDVSLRTQVTRAPTDRLSWGVSLFDYDNDGVVDLLAACGHVYPEEEADGYSKVTFRQRNLLMRGRGPPDFRFEDVTDRSGRAFEQRRLWRGLATGDLDDDGDADALFSSLREPPALWRNDGGNRNAWLRFDLRGRPPHASPAGARVTVDAAPGVRLVSEVHLGSSWGSCVDPRVHVGVGALERVPRVEVRWPDGTTTVLEDVETRRTHVVRQP